MTASDALPRRVEIADDDVGRRLDAVLASRLPHLTRTRIVALMRRGEVRVRGEETLLSPSRKARLGDVIDVFGSASVESTRLRPEPMALSILHEDEWVIVIDKPSGLTVHPGSGRSSGTLANALLAHCGESLTRAGGLGRPGIVHRLDKDTSGVMAAAKTDVAHAGLARQFASHGRDGKLRRSYLAIVWGVPSRSSGVIDAPLGRRRGDFRRMAAEGDRARRALTRWRLKEGLSAADGSSLGALLECVLGTGRTHQIRAHMAHIGHPLAGDKLYGASHASSARRMTSAARDALEAMDRQALHAFRLGFEHPVTGRAMHFESPLPDDMRRLLEAWRKT